MRAAPLLILLGLAAVRGPVAAAEQAGDDKDLSYDQLTPMMDILAAGSIIKGVRVPHFDKDKRRAALLRARLVRIVSKREITGEDIELRYFQQEKEIMRMHMAAADFSLDTGVLTAKKLITVHGKGVEGSGNAQGRGRGSGGLFHLETRTGFVRGPVSTRFNLPAENDEKKSTAKGADPEKPAPLPTPAEFDSDPFLEPSPLTPGERRRIDALLASRSKSVLADRAPTRAFMTRSQQLSNAADVSFRSFTKLVNQGNLLARVRANQIPPPRYELGKNELLVTCAGGMFLNPEKGHISYLRDVELNEARLRMTCSGHLKVFFEPRELTQANPDSAFNDLSDIKLIVASGGVRVIQHDPSSNQPPIIATGEIAIVDVKTRDIVLQGGSPTIKQGLNMLRAGTPDLYLRLYPNGNFFAEEGLWTTVGDLTELERLKDEESKKAEETNKSLEKKESPAKPEDAGADPPAPVKKPAGKDDRKREEPEDQTPKTVTATCTGGIYFDAKEGQLVYLGNVEIIDPRLTITARDEVKVFLRRKPNSAEEGLQGPEAFSDVDYVVASGAVRITRRDPDGMRAPITASAQHAILNVDTTEVILQGGSPGIRQGDNALQAGKADLYLRFYQNGSLYAGAGPWTTSGDLANLRSKPGDEKKPPEIITATCQGGLYFDSLKGHVVYLDEIVVVEPRFRMKSNGDLRIHLKLREGADEDRLEGPEAFSDVDKIVAIGGVTAIRKDPEGKAAPVTATAETATYDAATGILVLRGGYPRIQQGKSYLRAREPKLHILIDTRSGSIDVQKGKWENHIEGEDFDNLQNHKFQEGN